MRKTSIIVSLLPLLIAELAFAVGPVQETIVVTASRSKARTGELTSPVDLRERTDLEHRRLIALDDALRDVPGFAVSRQGGLGSATQVRVRGAEGSHLLVLIDGIRANDPAQGSEFNFGHLMASDVERLEIVKGPQSSLWGSAALGGVVNIITRGADKPLSMEAMVEAGGHGSAREQFSIAARGERAYGRLSTSHFDTDGENISRQGSEEDGYRNQTWNLKAGMEFSDQASVDLSLRQVAAKNDYDTIDFIDTGLPTDADFHSDTDQLYGGINARFEGSRTTQRVSATVVTTDNRNREFGPIDSRTEARRVNYAYQSDVRLSASQLIIFAVDHEREYYVQRGQGFGAGFDPNKNLDASTTSGIVEYRGTFSPGWLLSASARRDRNSDFDDFTSYRLSAAHVFEQSGTRIHLTHGRGHKNPSFTERFGYFDGFVGNPNLQPEYSEGWEFGVQQPLTRAQGELSLTWFDEQLEDEIDGFVFDAAQFSFTAANLGGHSDRSGVELGWSQVLRPGLVSRLTYAYLDASEPAPAGGRQSEVRRPRHQAGLAIDHAFGDDRGNLNLSVAYNGAQLDDYFPPYPAEPQRIRLNDFTLVGLAVSWQLAEGFRCFARVENLLDQRYEEVLGFSAWGRTVYAGLQYDFARD